MKYLTSDYLVPLTALAVFVMIDAIRANAQEIPSQFDLSRGLAASRLESQAPSWASHGLSEDGTTPQFAYVDDVPIAGEAAADSSARGPSRRLLPANMSIMEKGLWGEDGILRTTGIVGPLTPQERKSELDLRRTMLTSHQIGGFVTMAIMWSAVYFGQQIIDGHPEYRRNHQYAVTGTIITYSATGLLAILSPPPLIRRDEVSTTTIHKTLAWVHVAGMILTPILGGQIMHRHSTNTQIEHFHQISGYVTTAVFTASMITVTF